MAVFQKGMVFSSWQQHKNYKISYLSHAEDIT